MSKSEEKKLEAAAQEQTAAVEKDAAGEQSVAAEKAGTGCAPGDPEELVEYMAPVILGGSDKPVYVAVNGENILIRRGERVRIKRKFLEVLENAAQQEKEAYNYMNAAQRGGAKAMAEL